MSTRDLLRTVLERHNLQNPDGRALWRYDVRGSDVAALLEPLYRARHKGLTLAEQGALALVASFVLCPEDVCPGWSWSLLRERLPWIDDSPQFYNSLLLGFEQFWHRPLHRLGDRGTRAFLGTCFAEGGLPAQWLSPQHTVGRIIRHLVRRSELLEMRAGALIDKHSEELARSLQCPEIAQLCAEVAEHLVSLRARLPERSNSATRYLDQHQAGWRDALPLRIAKLARQDDLLDALIGDTAIADVDNALVEVATTLDEGHVMRKLQVIRRVTTARLRQETGVDDVACNGQVYALVQSADGKRHPLARLESVGFDGQAVWEVHRSRRPVALRTPGAVTVVFALRGQALGMLEPSGGAALDPESPWTFGVRSLGAPTLLGTGDVRTKLTKVLVCVARGAAAPIGLDGGGVEPADMDVFDRDVYVVVGRARVEAGQEFWTIETGAGEDANAPELTARGARLALGGRPDLPFVGVPQIVARNASGTTWPVADAELQWRPVHGGGWRRWDAQRPHGAVFVRANGGGRARLEILPDDFLVGVDPGGRMRLSGRGLVAVTTKAQGVSVSNDPEGRHYVQTGGQTSLAESLVVLHWKDAAPVTLSLPMHVGRAGFVRHDGTWMSDGAEISAGTLDRVRARASGFADHVLEIRTTSEGWNFLAPLPRSASGISELYLTDLDEDIVESLRASGQLDEAVSLRVVALGSATRGSNHRLRVRHYDFKAEKMADGVDWLLSPFPLDAAAEPAWPVDGLTARSLAIADPARGWTTLEREEDGRWRFVTKSMNAGPHLVAIHFGQRIVGRPLPLAGTHEGAMADSEFGAAATLPSFGQRSDAWAALCSAMAADWAHPSWASFHALIREGHPLPGASFELLRAAANSAAFAAAAMLHECDGGMRKRIREALEEAGLFWSGVAVQAWLDAHAGFARYLDRESRLVAALGGRSAAEAVLCPALNGSADAAGNGDADVPGVGVLRMLVRADGQHHQSLGLTPSMLWHLISERRLELRRRQGDRQWAQHRVSSDLERLTHDLPPSDDPPLCSAVLTAPHIAARIAMSGRKVTPQDARVLRLLRAFDRGFFDDTYTFHLALLLQGPSALTRQVRRP